MAFCILSNVEGGFLYYLHSRDKATLQAQFWKEEELPEQLRRISDKNNQTSFVFIPNPSGYMLIDTAIDQGAVLGTTQVLDSYRLQTRSGNKKFMIRDAKLQKFLTDIFNDPKLALIKIIDAFESALANLICHYYDSNAEVVIICCKIGNSKSYNMMQIRDNRLDKYKKISSFDSEVKKETLEKLQENIMAEMIETKGDSVVVIGTVELLEIIKKIDPKNKSKSIRLIKTEDVLGDRLSVEDEQIRLLNMALVGAAWYHG